MDAIIFRLDKTLDAKATQAALEAVAGLSDAFNDAVALAPDIPELEGLYSVSFEEGTAAAPILREVVQVPGVRSAFMPGFQASRRITVFPP